MQTNNRPDGYEFEVEGDVIIAATIYSRRIALGETVLCKTQYSRKLGIKDGRAGTVAMISEPDTNGKTTDIFGIDFENSGLPTAQLKIHEILKDMSLEA